MTGHSTLSFKPVPVKGSSRGWMIAILAIVALSTLIPAVLTVQTLLGLSNIQYELTQTELVLRFGPVTREVARSDIASVREMAVTGGRRVRGTGLPSLQQGLYTWRETGRIYMLSTTVKPTLMVIETRSGDKFGISPEDPAAFRAALESGQTLVMGPVKASQTGGMTFVAGLGLLVPLLVAGLVAFLIFGGQTLRYDLTPEGLEIRTRWGRTDVPYAKITGAETKTPGGFAIRTWASGVPGFYWGSFHWPNAGPGLKIYGTRMDHLVLVYVGPKRTYGISPEDEDRFVAELKRRLG